MQPLSLLALYEGYVTRYRGWERRGTIPLKRLRQVERHQAQLTGFLKQQESSGITAQDFSFGLATHFFTWLMGAQQYPPARASRHVRRLQRVLWWGVEQAYLAHNPLAGFSCPRLAGNKVKASTSLLYPV